MYTVSNRFIVKKGMGHKMAPAFISEKELLDFEGFQKVEVSVCTQNGEHDEMNVMMYWTSLENFQTWRASDSFKKLHSREVKSNGESPIISNQVIIAEIVATLAH
ncbi:antibiotic biosynthesis monooxygenase [Metasolibacillus meyeri]|uniref:Antibiotic biosynthesis monooxygenase n=1 Tax=Metasolibacillus meyeri TaxID=1071052 RepID=A0AAW9NPH1_9BACL|nr:antibiotic biosynthesis monooxygenase [Metasolibacillus meyeri]MEC1178386.1 antibiotic biosynthesis monooxygenase [Metasolibacillus meyeri]